jgi:hypothetical protein
MPDAGTAVMADLAVQGRLGAPDGAQPYRIVLHSTDGGGVPIDVTGLVIIPAEPASMGGRDIVAWAHGTSEIAHACAPRRKAGCSAALLASAIS